MVDVRSWATPPPGGPRRPHCRHEPRTSRCRRPAANASLARRSRAAPRHAPAEPARICACNGRSGRGGARSDPSAHLLEEGTMLKQAMALLAPVALIVAASACGSPSSSATGEDEQGNRVESTSSAVRQGGTGGGDQGGGNTRGPSGGGVVGAGNVPGPSGGAGGGGGNVPGPGLGGGGPGGNVPVPGGGAFGGRGDHGPGHHEHGGGGGYGRGGHEHGPWGARSHRGWVHGRWAPGWGWSNGQWILGGTSQLTCVSDADCIGPLGPGVAVCSYDPTIALGYCIAPSWY